MPGGGKDAFEGDWFYTFIHKCRGANDEIIGAINLIV
jgi:hypothetical protein